MRKELANSALEFGLYENKEIRYFIEQNFKYFGECNLKNNFHMENTKKKMKEFVKKCFIQFNFSQKIFEINNKFATENVYNNTEGISYSY